MKKLVVVLAGSAIALSVTAASAHHNAPETPRARFLEAEAVRLRGHFDSVDRELRNADISRLSASQRANRARLVSWLREYRDVGVFPENDRFADRMVPFFRDSHGTLCAMAYLIDRSGRGDIVDKVANTRNNAYISELADDPTLIAWLDEWGLTVAEAARIQPTYGPPPVISDHRERVDRPYAILSMGLGSVSMGTAALNLFAPSEASRAIGMLAATATIVAGGEHLRDRGGNKRMAQADLTVGSIAAVSALYAMFVNHEATYHPREAKSVAGAAALKWSPRLDVVGADGRVGVGLNARF
ncbi:MAG TPA: hypothetical protein VJ825_07020 [Gemmatimonadaceae bacterium]|nr:hypothetical protein [Gemmatimonadaceae bacterium]